MIISYTSPETWHMTDVIFFNLGYFLPFYPRAQMSSPRESRFANWICLFADHFKQFLWNSWIKTFLLLEFLSSGKSQSFCLHFKLDKWLISYSKKLNSTLFSCNGGLQPSPIPSNCWNFSLNLQGSLLKRSFEPCTPLTAPKMKTSKKWKKIWEISFYKCVPKIMIRWCMVPEIWCATGGQTDRRTDRWKKWHIEVDAPPQNTSKCSFVVTIFIFARWHSLYVFSS